jgi:putative FmdB family regulatory protein
MAMLYYVVQPLGRMFRVPLYEYECTKCRHRFEKIEKVSASSKKKCAKCGAVAKRLLAAPAIQFKGSGWYVTDYSGKSAGGDGTKGEKAETAPKTEKPAEAPKTEAAKESGTKKTKSKD